MVDPLSRSVEEESIKKWKKSEDGNTKLLEGPQDQGAIGLFCSCTSSVNIANIVRRTATRIGEERSLFVHSISPMGLLISTAWYLRISLDNLIECGDHTPIFIGVLYHFT